MAKVQGDHFKTWTDHSLNEYRTRLDAKLEKMIDQVEKQYKVNDFIIFAEQKNLIYNPNGSWKWNGWIIEGVQYKISMYHETECELRADGKYHPIISCSKMEIVNDKDRANEIYKEYVEFAKKF